MPVLFYGCENWSLCGNVLKSLNCFLGELCKRVLRLPKWYSNTAAMNCPVAEVRCLSRKLSFLRRVTRPSHDSLSSQTLLSLNSDIESVCLIQEYLELEEQFETKFTGANSDQDNIPSAREIKAHVVKLSKVIKIDKLKIDKCSKREDIRMIADVSKLVPWSVLWDLALNNGPNVVKALRAFIRITVYPSHSNRLCPICDVQNLDGRLLGYVFDYHMNTDTNPTENDILQSLEGSTRGVKF